MPSRTSPELAGLRRLRFVGFAEGATLLALVGIAVPLKHLAGWPVAVSVLGPVHGFAFLLYVWMVFRAVASNDWSRAEAARLVVAALLPFGTWVSAGWLKRQEAALASSSLLIQSSATGKRAP